MSQLKPQEALVEVMKWLEDDQAHHEDREMLAQMRTRVGIALDSMTRSVSVGVDHTANVAIPHMEEVYKDPHTEAVGYVQQIVLRSHKSAELAGYPWHEQKGTVCDLAEGALIALRKVKEPRIETPCPSCHHSTLFIGSGGHLTCSWLGCKEPGLEVKVQGLQAEVKHSRLVRTLYEGFITSTGLRQEVDRYFDGMGVRP